MLTEERLRAAVRAAGIDAPARFDEVMESTNRTALGLAVEGAPAWTVVGTGHQTAGRGRLGRTWVSRPGSAVMFSVLLRPSAAPERVGLLSLAAGVAGAVACKDAAGTEVHLADAHRETFGTPPVHQALGLRPGLPHELAWSIEDTADDEVSAGDGVRGNAL